MDHIRIRTLFFALYRDLVGVESVDLELRPAASARQAVEALRARGAGFERLPQQPAIALNQEFASLDVMLRDGDELALLPPLAGG